MNKDKKKLEDKINKRIGLKAYAKDNCKMATITGFTIEVVDENTPEARFTVNYLLAYGEGKHAVLRLVNENNVVVMLEQSN